MPRASVMGLPPVSPRALWARRLNPFRILLAAAGPAGASGDRGDRLLRRAVADLDVPLLAAEVDPPEAPEGPHLEDVDVRRLLRLVRGDGGVSRRGHLEDVEGLARHDQVA